MNLKRSVLIVLGYELFAALWCASFYFFFWTTATVAILCSLALGLGSVYVDNTEDEK